jgi:hypothetical protein
VVEGLADTCVNLALLCGGSNRPERAQALYSRAENLLRPIVEGHPEAVEAVLTWSALHCDWGMLVADPKRPTEALAHYDESVRSVEAVLQREPRYSRARSHGCNAHGARGTFLVELKRSADALRDWDRALELCDGPPHAIRLNRAVSLALLGEHVRATTEARALAEPADVPGAMLFGLGQIYAVALNRAWADFKLSAGERSRLCEAYGAEAVRLLRRAQAAGAFADRARLQLLKTQLDFLVLRTRPDCQELIKELEAKSQPTIPSSAPCGWFVP